MKRRLILGGVCLILVMIFGAILWQTPPNHPLQTPTGKDPCTPTASPATATITLRPTLPPTATRRPSAPPEWLSTQSL